MSEWQFQLLAGQQLATAYEGYCPFCRGARLEAGNDPALTSEENRKLTFGDLDTSRTIVFCSCCDGMFMLVKGRGAVEVNYEFDWRDGYLESPCEHANLIADAGSTLATSGATVSDL